MKSMAWRWLSAAALLASGGFITWFVVQVSFDPFLLAGSRPATIWGPSLWKAAVAIPACLLLAAAAWRTGRMRVMLSLLWLSWLAIATHRLVERGGDEVRDVWLTMTVRALPAFDEGGHCRVGLWLAHCEDGTGRTLRSVTPIPFVQLEPAR